MNSGTKHEPNSLQFQQDHDTNSTLTSIKLPSSDQQFNNDVDDQPTTPTSSDHKIPVPKCPPAPRKPRPVPTSNKRKTPSFRRVSVDLMVIFNAMFVSPEIVADDGIVAGDLDAGERALKVKKVNNVSPSASLST
ncbi:hypothetical protein QVD17_34339 [Tagetes erecta]|uniref:Uncharacterized protein n=1 Tax=Tagetes erecta TaxID=13708 RepID=A0AAD8NLL9_TARER|nr:hypothetical protein QVD17_34339 [Tagetes erecta]